MCQPDTATDDLMRLMNLPAAMRRRFVGIVRTSDGCYLGMEEGDCGYNAFIGKPSAPHPGPGRDSTLAVWANLTPERRAAVRVLATRPVDGSPIDLRREFGVPIR